MLLEYFLPEKPQKWYASGKKVVILIVGAEVAPEVEIQSQD